MDSLNSYSSGGESDSSTNVSVRMMSKKSTVDTEEADANCEPITMEMSEESDGDDSEDAGDNSKTELRNFGSKNESPASSCSSRSSSSSITKNRQENKESSVGLSSEKLKYKVSKEKHYNDTEREDQNHDRRNRDEKRSSHLVRRDERKRHHSRSRSPEYVKHKSSRYKHRSRSRSRSRNRYRHKRSKERGSRRSSRDRSRNDSRGFSKDRSRGSSRDRSRGRSKDRSRGHSRDHSRGRSKDRSRGHSRDHSRGRSKDRSRGHSRDRSRGHSRDHSRGRSKDRSRGHSRERSRERSSEHNRRRRHSPYRSRKSRSKSPKDKPKSYDWKSTSKMKVLEKLGIPLVLPTTNVVVTQPNLPTNVTASITASSNGVPLTPQLLLQKTMEEQVEKVKTATGIQLPSYYNPIAVNPSKYAEQMQKRKLLWSNKDKQPQVVPSCNSNIKNYATTNTESEGSKTIWQGAKFGGDQDGRMSAKFQRLMGIKTPASSAENTNDKTKGPDLIKKQEEMFNSMESQYEVARLATHSHRGLGLGFGTFQPR